MATEVIKYKAADGKVFKSEIEAVGHEQYLKIADSIEAFIAQTGLRKAQAGILRKYIPAYQNFVTGA